MKSKDKLIYRLLIVLALVGGVAIASFTTKTQNYSTSVVQNLEKTAETILLNVGITKVESQSSNVTIPWINIGVPLTEKKALIILNYRAKFGIKTPIKISQLSDKNYKIVVPKYEVLGIEMDQKEPYYLYDSRGELLSFATPNIDTAKLLIKAISTEEQIKYLEFYKEYINSSAEEYYTRLFKAIDSDIQLNFEFE